MILSVLCWRWLGLLFSVLNVFDLPLCARRKTLQQGTGWTARDLWPCPLPRMGWSLSVSCGSFDSSPCSEHSALRPPTSLSGCFSAHLWHPSTELKLFGPWDGGREPGHQHRQPGLRGGGAAVPSQLVCTILYSPSPCVSPPLSSIAMEKPCWCMYWHLYKCTSLKKKMKPWHIWNKWVTCVFIWISPLKNTNAAFKMYALCSCDIFSSINLV